MEKVLYILAILFLLLSVLFYYNIGAGKNKDSLIKEDTNNILEGELATTRGDIGGKSVRLFFFDNKINCKLDGDVYLDKKLIGKTDNGSITVFLNDSNKLGNNSILEIKGTTDDCFQNDQNLPFFRQWTIPNINYIEENLELNTNLTPRRPVYYIEMQGFIRPYETEDYLNNLKKSFSPSDIEYNLDKINHYTIRYRSDFLLFNESEYWQTPIETIEKGHGDCEDWAVTSLSMIKEYNDSLKCYNLLWEKHLSIFCYLQGSYIIYDQDKTKFEHRLNKERTLLENKAELREMRNNYFDYYGLKPNERKIYVAFNDKELVIFDNNEEFIDWLISFN